MKTQNIKDMGLAMKQVQEAGTATHRPNNGSPAGEGLSPSAKKEKERTSGVGVDANKSIDMSFKAFKAMNKKAPHNGNRTPPGDTAIVKSTTAPAANQKTEGKAYGPTGVSYSDEPNLVSKPLGVKKGKTIKGTIQPPKKVGSMVKKEAMDPVGQADADIDNDGDVDKADSYLRNRRKAIGKKMKNKGKGKVGEKAVMHGGKSGEKKNNEVMAVGEEK